MRVVHRQAVAVTKCWQFYCDDNANDDERHVIINGCLLVATAVLLPLTHRAKQESAQPP
jgi:hypothetical protein